MKTLDPKEMKVVFVGRRTGVNMGIIDWLDKNYTFCAAFFIEEGMVFTQGAYEGSEKKNKAPRFTPYA